MSRSAPTASQTSAEAASREVARYSARHLAFVVPLVATHVLCGLVFVVGVSRAAVVVFVATALAQILGVTLGYHRLLAHQSFETSRVVRFLLALLGTLAGQNGPLWWVGHHVYHHRHADSDDDIHSPRHGVFWSHMGWLFSPRCIPVRHDLVAHLARFPEIRGLERYSYVALLVYAAMLYAVGESWRALDAPAGVSGPQLVVWGSVVSTVCVYHIVFSIGSVAHLYGTRPFPTRDDSRNNVVLSVLLLGDGWHNNHHYCQYSARMGFTRWQFDVNYAILKLLARLGIVWDLRMPPKSATPGR